MGTRLEDLPEHLRKQVREQLRKEQSAAKGGDTGPHGKPEPASHHALPKGSSAASISTPVYLVVLCYRTSGLRWDLDNVSIKPFLDGLVQEGILEDDSCKEIQGLVTIPRKVKTKAEERTELEFWDASHFGKFIDAARGKGEESGKEKDSKEKSPCSGRTISPRHGKQSQGQEDEASYHQGTSCHGARNRIPLQRSQDELSGRTQWPECEKRR